MVTSSLRYDPSSYETQENPFPIYRRMQEEAPLYHDDELGFWALTRFDDVVAGLTDPATLSSARGTLIEEIQSAGPAPDMIIFQDPPKHDRMRKLVSRAFTPRRIGALEDQVRAMCADCLDPLVEQGGGDIVADLAGLLPMAVIATLLGVPAEDHQYLKSLSDRLLHREDGSVERPPDAGVAGAELGKYFLGMLPERRAAPRDDLTSALLAAEVVGPTGEVERLSDVDIASFCLLLGVAGNETTAKLIATGVVALADFPDERARLVADPELWRNGVEEVLRFDPPSHYQGRVTTRPVEWHGETVPEGEIVLLVNGAANRDPREFDQPDQFRADRRFDRHLAFGQGIHFCLGASMARLETRVALEELLRRFPDYDVDRAGIERFHGSNVRGLSKVPFSAVTR